MIQKNKKEYDTNLINFNHINHDGGCTENTLETLTLSVPTTTSMDFSSTGGKNGSAGSRTVTVTASANTSSSRTTTIKVNALGGDSETINVSQAAAAQNRGAITFRISSDLGCGVISVTLTGQGTRQNTVCYASDSPDCGASGTASYTNLPYGTYTFNASCNNYKWGPTTITLSNSCYKI